MRSPGSTLQKISNGVMGTELEADSNVSATSGNLFVYDGGSQYHFNWDTKGSPWVHTNCESTLAMV